LFLTDSHKLCSADHIRRYPIQSRSRYAKRVTKATKESADVNSIKRGGMSSCSKTVRNPMITLVDLSAAFDSVDHDTLLQRLQKSYGLGGAVADWFASYLSGRTQSVHSSWTMSAPSAVAYGVPQGSLDRSCSCCTSPTYCNWSSVINFFHMRTQTTLRSTGFVDLLRLTTFPVGYPTALTRYQRG